MVGNEPSEKASAQDALVEAEFAVEATQLVGGYSAVALRVAVAALPFALAFACPFAWAFVVYQILRSAEVNQATVKALSQGVAGYLTIHGDTIDIHSKGHDAVSRADVLDGWIEQASGVPYVNVRLTQARRLLVQPKSIDDAEKILQALGIGPAQQTARFALTSDAVRGGQGAIYHLLGPWIGIPCLFAAVVGAAAMMSTLTLGAVLTGLALLVGAGLLTYGFVSTVRRGSAIVGRDGMTVRRGFKERYIGYDEMRRVQFVTAAERRLPVARVRDGVNIELAKGSLTLDCGSFAADDPDTLRALESRLRHGLEKYRESQAMAEGGFELLERRGRPVGEWREALQGLVRLAADYRAARLNPVHLAEAVEDASASVERRLGAAIALAAEGQKPELQQRLRVAARACAHPKLRIALEKACDGELEAAAIEAALGIDKQGADHVDAEAAAERRRASREERS